VKARTTYILADGVSHVGQGLRTQR
jgi:hypothetical protein